jgi:NTE family protein
MQVVDFNTKNKFDDNMAITDIPIIVDTEGYSTASFSSSAIDTLIQRGEDAAMEHWDEIVTLKEKLSPMHAQVKPSRQETLAPLSDNPSCRIGQVEFENMTPGDVLFITRKFRLKEADSIDTYRANLITTSIRLDLFYESADFHVEPNAIDMPDGTKAARVVFIAGEKKPNKMSVGIRFDNEEMIAVQTNAAFPLRKRLPMQLDLTVRMGKCILAEADWEIHPTNFLHPTVTLAFRRNDINLYEYGVRSYNITYNRLTAMAAPLTFNVRNFHISMGAAVDYYYNYNLLLDQVVEHQMVIPDHEHFISYFSKVDYNSENDWYFPTQGSKFNARYGYYTDNFVKLNGDIGLHEVSAMWRTNFPIGRHLAIQPMFYGRLLHCKDTPVILCNVMGGEWFGHYFEQQMPFAGVGHAELQWDKLVAAQMQAQYSLTTNNFLKFRLAIAKDGDEYGKVMKGETMLGASMSYYYNSPSGPIGLSLGYSNVSEKLLIFFNLGYVF